MKIKIETLKKIEDSVGESWRVMENLSELAKDIPKAKARADILKNKNPTKKIRVIEYRNDEPDKSRTACKVVYEK
tara:strand:- start:304 stop:528 length:225 start_codon:yes stop_codon:yes gene_type:complete